MKEIPTIQWLFLTFLWLGALGNTTNSLAQNFDSAYQQGLRLELSMNEKAALVKFSEAHKAKPNNLEVLYKCSELCSRIGNREPNPSVRDRYYDNALAFAKLAYQHYPHSDDANVAMSIALGRIALTKSGKEKITTVKLIKQHAEKAIKANPNNFKAWHILGKWNYEVSNLSFIERAATKILYGGLPNASLQVAIEAYDKARKLNPYFCLNYLELAKAYYSNHESGKAISMLSSMVPIPNTTEDDPIIKKEASALLKKWTK